MKIHLKTASGEGTRVCPRESLTATLEKTIGSSNIRSTAARRFTEAGHEVAISNSRGPESLTDLVKDPGASARAATVSEPATFGNIVQKAIPFGQY